MIRPQPVDVADYLTDAAPVERAELNLVLTEVAKRTGDGDLALSVRDYALAYARAVADRAFFLGLDMGKATATSTTSPAAGEPPKTDTGD